MKENKYPNRNVINRKSPKNESEYIDAYSNLNPTSNRKDNLDIAAVTAVNGEKGHALVNQSFNRSKDKEVHRGVSFISDSELEKEINKH